MTIDEATQYYEKITEELYKAIPCDGCVFEICKSEHRQVAEWLKELQWYRKQIQNLIDNKSFEIVNPFNTYEYARVVRVADLYDLMEVNADDK